MGLFSLLKNVNNYSLQRQNSEDDFAGYQFRCIAFNDCKTIFPYLAARQTDAPGAELFVLYPNPLKQQVFVDSHRVSPKYDLSVYSVLGVEVYKKQAIQGKRILTLSTGTYLVKVADRQKTPCKKIIISA